MSTHVTKTCASAFYYLYNIRHIRKYLSRESTGRLVHAKTSAKNEEDFGRSHVIDGCPFLWNSLPLPIRQETSIDSFKRSVKTYLFKKAFS
ncbi:unnamed protein product [Porites lobata]|uniref:Uncharacterized protein n=1 Tax=Porites lobata TaxID=104759 RepID=A0ABN8PB49_9CNID|nr:unnamed protein product [Porites lobata]